MAEGVWRLKGEPGHLNVFFVRDGDGVMMFDAGGRVMVRAIRRESERLGGLTRIVLGHAHTDHRGAAPSLGVPVLCHPDEVKTAEGAGGLDYFPGYPQGLPLPLRLVHPVLHRFFWDGGPVKISGTLEEGDEIAGFRVVHLPGHAPGQIALWRQSDRLALSSDVFYTINLWGLPQAPRPPAAQYSLDHEQARESMRRLADLEPLLVWPGHARPVAGGSTAALLREGADA